MYCCCAAEVEEVQELPIAASGVLEKDTFKEGKKPASGCAFSVELKLKELRASQLGLEVDITDQDGMVISSISDGFVNKFNESFPDQALEKYDQIMSANGVRSSIGEVHKALMAAVQDGEVLQLELRRPSSFQVEVKRPGEQLGRQKKLAAS
ncbi:unnamed protein product [Effrenium voratum]|uniref:PDZ domain-containing protein n=1 Tax=Effrenium voratum TaxID=2562239 RepID=A0AA36HVS6_9DINO|nr:unnamed protein product [Effrenium voratum]